MTQENLEQKTSQIKTDEFLSGKIEQMKKEIGRGTLPLNVVTPIYYNPETKSFAMVGSIVNDHTGRNWQSCHAWVVIIAGDSENYEANSYYEYGSNFHVGEVIENEQEVRVNLSGQYQGHFDLMYDINDLVYKRKTSIDKGESK